VTRLNAKFVCTFPPGWDAERTRWTVYNATILFIHPKYRAVFWNGHSFEELVP